MIVIQCERYTQALDNLAPPHRIHTLLKAKSPRIQTGEGMTERERSTGRKPGKRILIRGTGGGQGAAALEAFCQEGTMVAGCYIKKGMANLGSGESAWR